LTEYFKLVLFQIKISYNMVQILIV